jgi:Zn-dependent M28 family amino/carboxypeptidase
MAMTSSAPSAAPALGADPSVVSDARKTLTYLASDELEGRGVGTNGLDLAASYIARRFGSLGLRTLPGQADYFQPFPYTISATVGDKTTLKVNDKSLERNKDFQPVGISHEGTFDAPAVFVGYGVSEPEKYHYDDYDGIDVKGKVVVALRYEPRDAKGNSRFTGGEWSGAAALTAKASAAASHGAAALVLVNPPIGRASMTATVPLMPGATSAPTTVALAAEPTIEPNIEPATEPATQPATQQASRAGRRGARRVSREADSFIGFFASGFGGRAAIPFVQVKQAAMNEFLQQIGEKDLKTLQTDIDDSGKPASHELSGARIAGNVQVERKQATVKNVMAMLPGVGPHADEYIIVGAHYDHLGRGMMGSLVPGSHDIHHGADDNGSGTTAVLELAAKLAHGPKLPRSIIFMTFTAEEEGLIGSEYFVDHPAVPLDKVVAMLNMDMVGRVKNDTLFVGGSGTASSFEEMVKHGDESSPLQIKFVGPMVDKGGMGPSDHQTFALKKIPVLFFFSGMHPDYHTPTDTADKINYDGLAESVALGEYFVRQMARMPRQQYVSAYDRSGMGGFRGGGGGVTLGVIPDYGAAESSDGVKIMGTREGSPAAAAGLKEGDVIVQLGQKKIASIYDLTDFLADAKPGQTVKATVQRDGHPLELNVTFAGRGPGGASGG